MTALTWDESRIAELAAEAHDGVVAFLESFAGGPSTSETWALAAKVEALIKAELELCPPIDQAVRAAILRRMEARSWQA